MKRRVRYLLVSGVALLGLALPIAGQSVKPVDLDSIYKIKNEGLNRSEIMETMSYLTDVFGPRLTNSPNIKAAAEWARDKLIEWELVNVDLETWGEFGRGWTNDTMQASIRIGEGSYPVIAYPKAWTPGTDGAVSGEVVMAIINSEEDFDQYRGKLKGKYVLTASMPAVPALFEPLARRLTDEDLEARASRLSRPAGRGRDPSIREFANRRMQFYLDEGVAALIEPGRGSGGTVFVQSGGSRNPDDPAVPTQLVMAVEHYGRIARTLAKDIPVTVEADVRNTFYDDDLSSYNVIAEIRGTDKSDEIVMLGGHFDSWHTGTGATDNASGSAVMLEAVRILKATNLRMRRTVRLALWTGEEQGLLGSDAYVKEHFGDRSTMQLKPDHATLSAYFNVDTGTGAIRGVSLNGNERIAPIFGAWMEPFRNLGMTTIAVGGPRQPPTSIGGTDHTSFEAVGLPGFGFIQDPLEYGTRTHHSNMDVYERIQPFDMMRNAVIVAAFVYHTANRDELLPRKPLHSAPRSEP